MQGAGRYSLLHRIRARSGRRGFWYDVIFVLGSPFWVLLYSLAGITTVIVGMVMLLKWVNIVVISKWAHGLIVAHSSGVKKAH